MKNLILPLLLLACPRAALAASAGADPFNFLFLDAGARPVALGGAYTALARDANALMYNPAGLGELNRHQAVLMHNQYFQEITQDYLAYGSPQGWGLAVNYLGFGSVRRTTVSNPAGTGLGRVGLTDLALSAGYGAQLGVNFAAGAAGKYIRETVAGVPGTAFALDLGLLYFPPGLERVVFGAAVQNLGPGVKFQGATENLPLNVRVGGVYSFKVAGRESSVSLDVTKARGEGPLAALGVETRIVRDLPLRFGYAARNAAGPGLAAGLGYVSGDLNFDYAFVPFGALGAAHRLSVGYKWGLDSRQTALPPPPVKAGPAPGRAPDYMELLSAGRESAAKQDYAGAAAAYAKALAARPGDPQVCLALADALMRTNKFKEADQAYANALDLLPERDPRRALALERRGAALFRLDKIAAAKKQFERAIDLADDQQLPGPVLENSYYGLAYCLEKEDRAEDAIRNYRLSLQVARSETLKKLIEKRLGSLVMQRPQ